jgi:hypothetical protein
VEARLDTAAAGSRLLNVTTHATRSSAVSAIEARRVASATIQEDVTAALQTDVEVTEIEIVVGAMRPRACATRIRREIATEVRHADSPTVIKFIYVSAIGRPENLLSTLKYITRPTSAN